MNLPEYVEQLYGELGNMHELKILQGFGFVVNCLEEKDTYRFGSLIYRILSGRRSRYFI